MQTHRPRPLVTLSRWLILIYRNFLSHNTLHACKFFPSCSQYALDAIERHGALCGWWHTARRLLRCHPFAQGGVDPVR